VILPLPDLEALRQCLFPAFAREAQLAVDFGERGRLHRPSHAIDLGDDEYVRLWCQAMGCTMAELTAAVEAIGDRNELVQD
jgi:hypothetical protein